VELGRLKLRADFLRVAAASQKCVRPGLILQTAKRPDGMNNPRVGFTATRKIGSAVARNRARRRLRAAVHEVFERAALPGHDYVLIARRETLDRPYADLLKDLTEALRKLGAARERGRPERERAS
jgi:ribonuclease P protein component